jgi:hypothetical protein
MYLDDSTQREAPSCDVMGFLKVPRGTNDLLRACLRSAIAAASLMYGTTSE